MTRLSHYPAWFVVAVSMGCIPSKQKVLDGDSSTTVVSSRKEKRQKKQKKGPPSPVTGEDAPPWLHGHKVLTEKDGTIVITERAQM
ncbi:hypothetical protein BD414DRAFT_483982 [Trametes punicea]|nr:hypothetical protein BD414DRAFT_483982 [Trametes punicea]